MLKGSIDHQSKGTGRQLCAKNKKSGLNVPVRFVVVTVCVLFLQKCSAYAPSVDDVMMIETIPASWVMQNEASSSSITPPAYSSFAISVPMCVKDVKEALEYTSQLNRKMQENALEDRNYTAMEEEASPSSPTPTVSTHHFRGGGCSTTLRVPLDDISENGTTMFHSRPNEPLLEVVLQRVLDVVPASNKDMLLTLALVYLDRACSVDTNRLTSAPACPFCAPDTICRLFLSAFLIAARANGIDPDYTKLDKCLGVSRYECEDMMAAMTAALGEPGVYVTPDEIQSFAMVWQKRFPTAK